MLALQKSAPSEIVHPTMRIFAKLFANNIFPDNEFRWLRCPKIFHCRLTEKHYSADPVSAGAADHFTKLRYQAKGIFSKAAPTGACTKSLSHKVKLSKSNDLICFTAWGFRRSHYNDKMRSFPVNDVSSGKNIIKIPPVTRNQQTHQSAFYEKTQPAVADLRNSAISSLPAIKNCSR